MESILAPRRHKGKSRDQGAVPWRARHSLTHVEVGYDDLVPEVTLQAPRPGRLRVELDRGGLPPYGSNPLYSGIELKRYFPSGALASPSEDLHPDVVPLDAGGRKFRVSFEGLPAGRYRLRTQMRGDCTDTVLDVRIREGEEAAVDLAVGPPADPVELVWDRPIDARTRATRFNVNSFLRSGSPDVESDVFEGTSASWVTRSLRPGRYLLILWDLELAMLMDVHRGGEQKIVVRPPPELLAPAGERRLSVELTVDEQPCAELPILLAPVREDPWTGSRWFRMQRTQSAGPHHFDRLSAGVYDVLVLDGGLGLTLGLKSSPVVRRVDLREHDETVRFDL